MPRPENTALTPSRGAVADPAAVIELATGWAPRFTQCTESTLETLRARYASFTPDGAERDDVLALVDRAELPGEPSWVVLRRYQTGDYALPHRSRAELGEPAEQASWVVVCTLTESTVDGSTFWDGTHFVRVMDKAGYAVATDPEAWCWTSPVRGRTRFTVTLGGRDA